MKLRGRAAPISAMWFAALSLTNLILLGAFIDLVASDTSVSDEKPMLKTTLSIQKIKETKASSLRTYDQSLSHPKFFKSRFPFVPIPVRPTIPKSRQVEPNVAPDPNFALAGIAIKGAVRKAYIFSRASPKGAWVAVGDILVGWTLQSIETDQVVLQFADRMLNLQLYPRR